MSFKKNELKRALSKLDPRNADHWTGDGSPKLEALGIKGLLREDVTKFAPHFTREHPTFELPSDEEDEVNTFDHPSDVGGFSMESSEFGEDNEPLHKVALPPMEALPADAPTLQAELANVNEEMKELIRVKGEILARQKVLEDRAGLLQQRMGLEVTAQTNQARIMAFLASTQKQPHQRSVLDKAHDPRRDPTAERPQFSNKE